jgi:hypothetical protein
MTELSFASSSSVESTDGVRLAVHESGGTEMRCDADDLLSSGLS